MNNVITRVLTKGRQEGQREKERLKEVTLLVLKMKYEAMS